MSVPDSIQAAINTSGRAVLFAGTTVCVAMLGLTLLGVSFFYGMAIGTAIAVSLTMIASVTLLPALLSLLGLKVLPRKQRRAVRAGSSRPSTPRASGARWSEFVCQPPGDHRPARPGRDGHPRDPVLRHCGWDTPTRATTGPAPPPARATT